MRKAIATTLLVSGLTGSTAVAEDLPSWMGERRIIGNNDLEPIEAARGTRAYDYASVVARVETTEETGFCTASRVAKDLFLTNYHCYEFKPCAEVQFRMSYEAGVSAQDQKVFGCQAVLAKSLELDYALYHVRSDAGRTHRFPNLGLRIPDNDRNGVRQRFSIDQVGSLRDIEVHVKLTHTYIGDLVVDLVSPQGTVVELHNQVGGSSDDINKKYSLADGLDRLLGEDPKGIWTIFVADHARVDTGTLESVTFTLTTNDGEAIEKDDPVAILYDGPIHVGQQLLLAGHPSARKKEIDRSATCVLRTTSPEVISQRQTITHTCDTEGGSSGSPVLDRFTGLVVALHWGGTFEYNLSVPMSLILDDLAVSLSDSWFRKLTIQR